MSDNKLPVEVCLVKAKYEILQAINRIGSQYELPSSIVTMLVEQIVADTKNNIYSSVIQSCDITSQSESTDNLPKES